MNNTNDSKKLYNDLFNDDAKEFIQIYSQIIKNNSMNLLTQLHNLINSKKNLKWFFMFPINFHKIISFYGNTNPPEEFGPTNYEKVISSYESGLDKGVDELLNSIPVNNMIRANAYTALARHLIKKNTDMAYDYARKAFTTDPAPYRLKWLAFRAIDSKRYIIAKTIIEILPSNTLYSESEKRKLSILESSIKDIIFERNSKIKTNSETRDHTSPKIANKLQLKYNALLESFKLAVQSSNKSKKLLHAQKTNESSQKHSDIFTQDSYNNSSNTHYTLANDVIEDSSHTVELKIL